MPKSKKKPKALTTGSTGSASVENIHDLDKAEFNNEILLVDEDDLEDKKFTASWIHAREKHGSYIIGSDAYVDPDPTLSKTKIQCITKVGHGRFYTDSMVMVELLDSKKRHKYKNHIFIQAVKNTLLWSYDDRRSTTKKTKEAPTESKLTTNIHRINLYACKSGLTPIASPEERSLESRLALKEKSGRFQFGNLSYAEYFILKLKQSFDEDDRELPKNLHVVACLGDVKDNGGKVTVSRKKRPIGPESYLKVDPKTSLVKIDCDQFLAQYAALEEKLKITRGTEETKLEITHDREEKKLEITRGTEHKEHKPARMKPSLFNTSHTSEKEEKKEKKWSNERPMKENPITRRHR